MDGHGRRAGLLHHTGKLHTVDGALVPAQTEFDGDGPSARAADHGLQHPGGQLRGAHEPRAVPALGHLGDRTAHVDVDDLGARDLGGQSSGLFHAGRVAAEDLGGGGMLDLPQLEQGDGFFVLVAERLGADHLGDGVAAAQLPANRAEAQIGDAGHGGQDQFGRYGDAANVQKDPSLNQNDRSLVSAASQGRPTQSLLS